jgi:hypothetical protein
MTVPSYRKKNQLKIENWNQNLASVGKSPYLNDAFSGFGVMKFVATEFLKPNPSVN